MKNSAVGNEFLRSPVWGIFYKKTGIMSAGTAITKFNVVYLQIWK